MPRNSGSLIRQPTPTSLPRLTRTFTRAHQRIYWACPISITMTDLKPSTAGCTKCNLSPYIEQGYGLLRPQRDSSGNLINGGQINLITPAVHIPDNGFAAIFNATLAPGFKPGLFLDGHLNWWLQCRRCKVRRPNMATLRSFYQTNAISTVKLLQQVAPNMVILTADNYVAAGQVSYNGVQLQNADPTTWNAIVNLFTRPAAMTPWLSSRPEL